MFKFLSGLLNRRPKTRKEKTLDLFSQGYRPKEIAEELGISPSSVYGYLGGIRADTRSN